ncbi:MAG: BamA/TamA family outer membrane protein [Candidatus Eiseniibacteriota bacterium]
MLAVCLSSPAADGAAAPGATARPDSSATQAGIGGVHKRQLHSRLLPPRLVAGRFVFLPTITYRSETSFGLGGELAHTYRWPGSHPDARDSDIRLRGRRTLNGHTEAELTASVYSCRGCLSLKTKLRFTDLPLRFYGIGRDTPESNEEVYRPQSLLYYVEVLHPLAPHLRLGLRYEIENQGLRRVESGGLLATDAIRGTEKGRAAGAGLLADWDTRDHRYAPRHGMYHQVFALVFDEALGSDYDFNNYNLDLRWYDAIGSAGVLATQLFCYAARGQPPFWRLAALGGRAHSRGYRRGRYLDHVLVAGQLEFRTPLYHRLGLAVFGGLADVAPAPSRLRLADVRPTVGGGLRVRVASSGLRARLDVAAGAEGVELDFGLGEAF